MLSNWFCWIDWRPYNLTLEEVKELYHQYQQESGQAISAAVVDKVWKVQSRLSANDWDGHLETGLVWVQFVSSKNIN